MSLAETIERDLADRIQSGRALPARLTLGALADAYGVSATPVRTAVDGLVRRRLVRRDGSGRLSVRGGERCDATAIEAPIQLARDLDCKFLVSTPSAHAFATFVLFPVRLPAQLSSATAALN